jgi:UDP-N-acetylglucosamine 2-epimerase (non-hydrolysing)
LSRHIEKENINDPATFIVLMNAINKVAENYNLPIVYSTHPRSWKRIEESSFQFHPLVRQLKPFGSFDYNCLQMNSFCVLSDSGTL